MAALSPASIETQVKLLGDLGFSPPDLTPLSKLLTALHSAFTLPLPYLYPTPVPSGPELTPDKREVGS